MKKLLILDGIGGVPLGREMADSFIVNGVQTSHLDCAKLPKIRFYNLRSAVAKLINRAHQQESFYHLPRLDINQFSSYLEKEQPTHILVIGFIYKFIEPRLLAKLCQCMNCKIYLYDTDSCNLYAKRREFIFFLEQELPIYQEIFSFSKVTTYFFRHTKKLNASHFPFGAKPIGNLQSNDKVYDVLFVGSGDLRRIFLLEHIKEFVNIFGNRWKRNFPITSVELQQRIEDIPLWGDALYDHLKQSKIVLNITRTHFYAAETGVNLRIFEALAGGCFLLTDYCEEVVELFDEGIEIETFSSAKELKQKVEYYLANPDKREEIAKRGHEKFMKLYTWDIRVSKLSQDMHLT